MAAFYGALLRKQTDFYEDCTSILSLKTLCSSNKPLWDSSTELFDVNLQIEMTAVLYKNLLHDKMDLKRTETLCT